MDNKKRLILSVSFSLSKEHELYNYVKNKPNSSYYIKELIKRDINTETKQNQDKTHIDEVSEGDIINMMF